MSDQHLPPDPYENPGSRADVGRDPYAPPVPTGYGVAPGPAPAGPLAVVALVLAVAAFVLGWLPYLGLVVGVAALVVSVLALRRSGQRGRKAMAVVAVVLAGLGSLAGLSSTAVWSLAGGRIEQALRGADDVPGTAAAQRPGSTGADRDPQLTHVLVVGEDIEAGLYVSAPPADGGICIWSRLGAAPADPSMPDHEHQLSRGSATGGPAAVEVLDTDYGLQTIGCGKWSPVDPATVEPSDRIGPGQHFVGLEMEPGLWQASGDGECAWMTNATATQQDEYTGIQTGLHNAVVDLQPTDAVFSTYDCGTWTKVPEPLVLQPVPADGVVPVGDNLVGSTLAPGTYVSTASSGELGCYWQKFSDTRMQDRTVNGLHTGPHVVEVESADAVFSSSEDCGGWVPLGTTAHLRDTVGDGDWVVGLDAVPGTYTSNHDGPAAGNCLVEAFSDATHQQDAVTGREYDVETFTLEPGDRLVSLERCGTYTRTS